MLEPLAIADKAAAISWSRPRAACWYLNAALTLLWPSRSCSSASVAPALAPPSPTGAGSLSTSASARTSSCAVANRASTSTAVAFANHPSSSPGSVTPHLAARAVAGLNLPVALVAIFATDSLPRLGTGKIDRVALKAQYAT